uniref:Meiosis-specific protein MEI4 isoform X1 n=1 Tax=Pogona vitticeps TaxID=103695 RepID=A0A6J0URC6_9SAUR
MEGLGASAWECPGDIERKEDVTWYLKTSQVALAIAIIRSKPPDKSSKEYAEQLAKAVSGQNSKWKLRVETLEAEVLHLRRQLLLREVSSGFSVENRTSGGLGEAVLPSNTEDCSDHFEDSGCDTSSDHVADTLKTCPSLNYREHNSVNSVSDASSNTLPILTSVSAQSSKSLLSHIQFLQYFIELRKLTEAGGLRTDMKKLGKDGSLIFDSFSRLIDGLVTLYSLPELPFSDVVTQAVCVITRLLSDADLSCLILGRCIKKLEDFVKRLVAIILKNSNLSRFQMQDSISHALVLLGRCSTLRNFTVSLLFREVTQFAEELQHMNEMQAKFSVQYENIFFLCKVLEQLLGRGTEQEKAARSDCDEEKKKILQSLNQAVFHLSDEFPLFCIYLWRLGTLLNAAQIEAVEKTSPAL